MSANSTTVETIVDMVKEFFCKFKKGAYIDSINLMPIEKRRHIELNYLDLLAPKPKVGQRLSILLLESPERVIEAVSIAIREMLHSAHPEYAEFENDILGRIINYPIKKNVFEINALSSGKFFTIKAKVTEILPVGSIPVIATFICPAEHLTTIKAGKNLSLTKPTACDNEKCAYGKDDLEMVGEKSKFIDCQFMKIQDIPEVVPADKSPKSLWVFISGDIVDMVKEGNIVEIVGIIRPEPGDEIRLTTNVQTYNQKLYANSIKIVAQNEC